MALTVTTQTPAKLNLFLELLGKRDDGFHEIDTVMVPIDWCDQLQITKRRESGIRLRIDWLPSHAIVEQQLGTSQPLAIPVDETNLVYRALQRFTDRFSISSGFDCQLLKRIPPGAGLGGASSDAAAALRCAAALTDADLLAEQPDALVGLAAELGSDVPFFLGSQGGTIRAARATGRGEIIEAVPCGGQLDFVVVFPGVSLPTSQVYANSLVPLAVENAAPLLAALAKPSISTISEGMFNRLSQPARKIVGRIDEILESLWRAGLQACQLTGSGSACFGIARSQPDAVRAANQLRGQLQPGALVMATQTIRVPMMLDVANDHPQR